MAASAYYDSIQKMYMAFYGRPADPTGLETWAKIADKEGGMTLNVLANFVQGAEAQALYGNKSNAEVVNAAYNYLFGRDAEPAALTTWAAGVSSSADMANLLWNIMAGAAGADKVAVDSKLAAAKAFTASVDTTAEILAFNGAASNAAARSFLATVKDADTLAAATAPAALAASVLATTSVGTSNVGQTFTLTAGTDTLTGTSGNDTFTGLVDGTTAANTTYSAADTINGGAGNDTLNIVLQGNATANVPAGVVSGIETVSVRNVSAGATALDGSLYTGATKFVSATSTAAVTFDNIGTADVTVEGNGATELGNLAVTVGTSPVTDAFTLNVAGGALDTNGTFYVNDTDADWTSATINSTGKANRLTDVNLSGLQNDATTHTITSLTIDAASDLRIDTLTGFAANATLTIKGAGKVDLDATALQPNIDTIDASANTGGAHVALDTETDTKFTGGTGNDRVTAGSVAYVAANTAAINAGDGTDTLVVGNNNALSTAASGAKFTNFEVLEVTTNATIDMDNISGINSLILNNTAIDLNDVSATQAGAITVRSSAAVGSVLDVAVKGAATVGQIDTLKITVDDALAATNNISIGSLTSDAVENLEVTANDNTFITALTAANDLTSIKLSGSKAINLTTGALAVNLNTTVNAADMTGRLTFDADASTANGFAITGGSGNDVFAMSDDDVADNITGGAGNDTIYANGAVNEVQTITFVNSATAAGTVTVTLAGQTVTAAVANSDAVATIATAVEAALEANATLDALGYDFSAALGVVTITAPASAGDIASATVNMGTVTATTGTVLADGTGASVVGGTSMDNVASDTMTGGDGNDTFFVGEGGAVGVMDIIKDLNLGDNTAGGTVDLISFGGIGAATAEAVITLTTQQQETVSQAASVADAVDAALNVASTTGNVVMFTYGTDKYIAVQDTNTSVNYTAGEDIVIKVTGVTGTLDVNDFSFTA